MNRLARIKRILRYDWPLHFILRFTDWLPDNRPFLRLRGFLAAPFLGQCGADLLLGRNISFYNPRLIFLGSDVYIAYGCWFSAGEKISIGDEVQLAPYCIIASSNHSLQGKSYRYGAATEKPIRIEKGCWIAAHCVLTAGSHVGEGTLIGAASVVSGDIPAHSVAAGAPARIVKTINDENNK